MVEKLHSYLSKHVEKPYTFIVGGCLGFDSVVARYAIANNVPFELHVPFPVKLHAACQSREGGTKEEAYFLLEQHKKCIKRVIIAYEFDKEAYYKRDQSMANSCDLLLCYYYKEESGTGKCVRYAKSIGKPIINLRTWNGG